MEKTFTQRVLEPSVLKSQSLLLLLALYSGHLILTLSRDAPFWVTMALPQYPRAMAFSSSIALVLIELIYWMARVAQNYWPANYDYIKYLKWRFALAAAIPLIIAPVLTGLYYKLNDLNIFTETTYFRRDYIVVVLLVFLANTAMELLLRIQDRYSYDGGEEFLNDKRVSSNKPTMENNEPTVDNEEPKIEHVAPIEEQHKMSKSFVKAPNSFYKIDPRLGIIVTMEGKVQAFDRGGNPATWDKWITESIAMLTPDYFCLNQSYIVHKTVIAAAWFSTRQNGHYVKLDCYEPILKVARSKMNAFKAWCSEYGVPISKEKSNLSMLNKLK